MILVSVCAMLPFQVTSAVLVAVSSILTWVLDRCRTTRSTSVAQRYAGKSDFRLVVTSSNSSRARPVGVLGSTCSIRATVVPPSFAPAATPASRLWLPTCASERRDVLRRTRIIGSGPGSMPGGRTTSHDVVRPSLRRDAHHPWGDGGCANARRGEDIVPWSALHVRCGNSGWMKDPVRSRSCMTPDRPRGCGICGTRDRSVCMPSKNCGSSY
jgi:hypothetical protein